MISVAQASANAQNVPDDRYIVMSVTPDVRYIRDVQWRLQMTLASVAFDVAGRD